MTNRIRMLCLKCTGIDSHYLTCPTLLLPPGYKIAEDPGRLSDPSEYDE
jgi:hypothetical protein